MKSNLSRLSFDNKEGTSNQSTPTPSILTARINETKNDSFSGNKETLSVESMSYCARFEICSAPKCPLDILIDLRFQDPEDPKCEMAKATRRKYWLSMPDEIKSELRYQGYLESEYTRMRSAKERWLALPEQQKAEIKERMKNMKNRRPVPMEREPIDEPYLPQDPGDEPA